VNRCPESIDTFSPCYQPPPVIFLAAEVVARVGASADARRRRGVLRLDVLGGAVQ